MRLPGKTEHGGRIVDADETANFAEHRFGLGDQIFIAAGDRSGDGAAGDRAAGVALPIAPAPQRGLKADFSVGSNVRSQQLPLLSHGRAGDVAAVAADMHEIRIRKQIDEKLQMGHVVRGLEQHAGLAGSLPIVAQDRLDELPRRRQHVARRNARHIGDGAQRIGVEMLGQMAERVASVAAANPGSLATCADFRMRTEQHPQQGRPRPGDAQNDDNGRFDRLFGWRGEMGCRERHARPFLRS